MDHSTALGPEVRMRPGDTPQSELSVPGGQLMLYVVVPALCREQ